MYLERVALFSSVSFLKMSVFYILVAKVVVNLEGWQGMSLLALIYNVSDCYVLKVWPASCKMVIAKQVSIS